MSGLDFEPDFSSGPEPLVRASLTDALAFDRGNPPGDVRKLTEESLAAVCRWASDAPFFKGKPSGVEASVFEEAASAEDWNAFGELRLPERAFGVPLDVRVGIRDSGEFPQGAVRIAVSAECTGRLSVRSFEALIALTAPFKEDTCWFGGNAGDLPSRCQLVELRDPESGSLLGRLGTPYWGALAETDPTLGLFKRVLPPGETLRIFKMRDELPFGAGQGNNGRLRPEVAEGRRERMIRTRGGASWF